MAKPGKSRKKVGTAPKSKPRRRASIRRSKAKSGKAATLEGFVLEAALALALPIKPQWLPTIAANLEANLHFAALVADFALPDESEPAPVFRA